MTAADHISSLNLIGGGLADNDESDAEIKFLSRYDDTNKIKYPIKF
jgi:hypothetical protein